MMIWKWVKRILSGLVILTLGLATGTWLAGAWAKSRLRQQYPPPGQLVDVGGFKMHLYCTGSGSPTVILESGLNDFFVAWAKVQPEVARTTRVCSYDRAGLGWSEASPRPRTSDVMAEELHTLLTNAGVEGPYILVGHSFGGINVRLFAQKYPNEVAGMVLVDSAHEQQPARLPMLNAVAGATVGQFRQLAALSSLGVMALSPAAIPNRGLPDAAYKQYQAVLATTGYFDTAAAETSAFYASRLGAPASLGDLPLIVLSHGLPDAWTGVAESQKTAVEQEWSSMQTELVGLSTISKQVIAKTSTHYIQLDQPELVVAAILELLRSAQ